MTHDNDKLESPPSQEGQKHLGSDGASVVTMSHKGDGATPLFKEIAEIFNLNKLREQLKITIMTLAAVTD